MNTLNRDRNILKRLVESYGKKDVLKFVEHVDETFPGHSNPLNYTDSYDVFGDEHVAEVFEENNFNICVVANLPGLEGILKHRFNADVIERGNCWLIVDWNPDNEVILRPDGLEPLIPYDDEHILFDEALRDWKTNRPDYIRTL